MLAELLARPLQDAGYQVAHDGTIAVGESLIGAAQNALTSGSPIVLCATAKAVGSAWAHQIVNAAHRDGPVRVFVVQMEKQAFVKQLALDGKIARYCDDPAQALNDLMDALEKHFPPSSSEAASPGREDSSQSESHFLDHELHFLDQPTASATFDIEALQRFRNELRSEVAARYPEALTAWEFLDRAGLRVEGKLTRTGALLFARDPVTTCPTAMVKCTRYYHDDRAGRRDIETFDGTVPTQIVAARQFVADRVRVGEAPSADQAQSSMIYDYPMVAVREVVANALVHRDYSSAAACVHVRIFLDRLEVSSPGNWLGRDLPEGTEHPLVDLKGQSIKRNFRLAHILSWIRLVEGEGSGIPSALRACQADRSPAPTVRQEQGFVTVTLYRSHRPSEGTRKSRGSVTGVSVHRTIVALDVERFGDPRRTDANQVAVRAAMYEALRNGFAGAGIDLHDCDIEDRGDGVLILVPPDIPKSLFVEMVPGQLASALRQHNRTHTEGENIRLRMALHAGEVRKDAHGFTGGSLTLTLRLLDAPALASALASSPGTLALITSSWFFEEVVRHSNVQFAAYSLVSLAVKETRTQAWVCAEAAASSDEPPEAAPAADEPSETERQRD